MDRVLVLRFVAILVAAIASWGTALAGDGNRLAYLDEMNPYYPGRNFPKLVTPQWVGEEGVEAVVVLAIDDMRGYEKWETYLRPILERLKQIDGRAPVSIMTCDIDPKEPHLQTWLKEGLSIEVHTVDHPCPLLSEGGFCDGEEHVRPVRRSDERDTGQPAGGVSDAVLRFAEHAEPAVLGGDLQSHDGARELPDDRQLGVQRDHAERSGAAARAGAWRMGASGSGSTCRFRRS